MRKMDEQMASIIKYSRTPSGYFLSGGGGGGGALSFSEFEALSDESMIALKSRILAGRKREQHDYYGLLGALWLFIKRTPVLGSAGPTSAALEAVAFIAYGLRPIATRASPV